MNIYLVSQNENNDYDTHDSFVCFAKSEEAARNMHPDESQWTSGWGERYTTWCSSPDKATVKYLGENTTQTKEEIILASFNAG